MNYDEINDCKAAIFDGDKTLWKGRIAEGIGKKYIGRELKRGHIRTVLSGINGALDVYSLVKKDPDCGEALGLSKFYEVLSNNGLGTEPEMCGFAVAHISEKKIDGVEEFLKRWYPKKTFLATLTGSSAANMAASYFGIDGFVSNKDVFGQNGQLIEAQIELWSGKDKLKATEKMLAEHGYEIEDCVVFVDGANDIPLIKRANISVASPLATKEIKNMTDIQIERSYLELLNN